MTLQEFIKKYNGKGVDWDGYYGNQCVDLFRKYLDEVLGFPQPKGVRGAYQFWENYDKDPALKNNFEKIPNTPSFVPQAGDIAVWNRRKGGGYGHIAICTGKGNTRWFESFDQNWVPQKATLVRHDYKDFYGVLRPKKQEQYYKGLDLNNKESMKAVVDLWVEVIKEGKWIKKREYEKIKRDLENCRKSVESFNNKLIELNKEKEDLEKALFYEKEKNKELKKGIELMEKQLRERDVEFSKMKRKIATLEKQVEITENKAKADLDKAKIDYEKKLEDARIRMAKDFELKEKQLREEIAKLKESKKEVVEKRVKIPKDFLGKLMLTISIWRGKIVEL